MTSDKIETGLGTFSKDKFNALVTVRAAALKGLRDAIQSDGFTEVTTASLVNIAGSCENPHASFTLNFYGREAHLSQSAQLQLEALVIRLRKGFFTVNTSFREEHFDDPEAAGRRLSEFTLIEPECPFSGLNPDEALEQIIEKIERIVKQATESVLKKCKKEISALGGDPDYIQNAIDQPFQSIKYDDAIELLKTLGFQVSSGDDLGVREERAILAHFGGIPTFVTHHPASIKFFNMKRTADGKQCFSVDLLTPKLGETVGGAVREEDGEIIEEQLRTSKIGAFLKSKGQDPTTPFTEYFNLFKQEDPLLRGGFGIGFERYVGFLIGSNDILNTISHRTLSP